MTLINGRPGKGLATARIFLARIGLVIVSIKRNWDRENFPNRENESAESPINGKPRQGSTNILLKQAPG